MPHPYERAPFAETATPADGWDPRSWWYGSGNRECR
jgi:hypothetical protein